MYSLERPAALIIGASGAIGTKLTERIADDRGDLRVVAAVNKHRLAPDLAARVFQETGVDVCNPKLLLELLERYKGQVGVAWNLAAPLSVDTAKDPSYAEKVTVGGMGNLLEAMRLSGVQQICFSDSIGSFGASAPRERATARWLTENPDQDPGSDYGKQKRACRELMSKYAVEHGFDSRWAVIPGVLHDDETWGGGTTEYALDAIRCAVTNRPFVCPIPADAMLPMIDRADLIDGLVALMDAPRENLREPEGGYALAGFSFNPEQLFALIKQEHPHFQWSYDASGPAARFSKLWPDSISGEAAERDLGFKARFGFEETIQRILATQNARQSRVRENRISL